MSHQCPVEQCSETPIGMVMWGSDALPRQSATLCQTHSDELWGRVHHLVSLGKVWYSIMPLEGGAE